MTEYYPKNMWVARYNGENIVVKATVEELEELVKNDPKMTDYVSLRVYKFDKGGK